MSEPASSSSAEDNVSLAYVVTIPTIVTTVLALIMTGLRVYVRIHIIKVWGYDDFFNVLAMVVVLVIMGLNLAATHYGLGRHFGSLTHEEKERASFGIMLLRINEFFLIFSTVFVKISISLFLKRLFLTSKKWRMFFWAFIAFNTITSTIDAIAIFPQCTPVEYNWNKGIEGHCWSDTAINALGVGQGSIAAVTDVILSVLPLMFLWNLKMLWRVKLAICGIMSLGLASGAFAVARTVLVPNLTTTKDPTWDLVPLFMWATLEATFGVIAAAAPALRPLLGRWRRGTGYSGNSKSKSQSRNTAVPLSNLPSSRRSWLHGQHNHMQRIGDDDEHDVGSDGSSQHKLFAKDGGAIVRTTDIQIVHEPSTGSHDRHAHARISDDMM